MKQAETSRRSLVKGFDLIDYTLLSVVLVLIAACGFSPAWLVTIEAWSDFATPLVTLVGSVLVLIAIRIQLREYKQALVEMNATTTNHASALAIAKHEKEFNVCYTLMKDIVDEVNDVTAMLNAPQGGGGSVGSDWADQFLAHNIRVDNVSGVPNLRNTGRVSDRFLHFNLLLQANQQLHWFMRSIKEKEMAPDDREYFLSIGPSVHTEFKKMTSLYVHGALNAMEKLLERSDGELSELLIRRETLEHYIEQFKVFEPFTFERRTATNTTF